MNWSFKHIAIPSQWKKNRQSIYFITSLILVSLLAPVLANDEDLILIQNQSIYFPAFSELTVIADSSAFRVSAPIPYSSTSIDYQNMSAVGPFDQQTISSWSKRHWLGTDNLGRDLLAGLIYGCQTALYIGFTSMLLAFLLAVLLGGAAGYFAENGPVISLNKIISFIFSTLLYLSYLIAIFPWYLDFYIVLIAFLFITFIYWVLYKAICLVFKFWTKKTIQIPIDQLILRVIEIIDTLPVLFLIIALTAVFKQTKLSLILIIALVAWTGMAKHLRSQVLKIRSLPFIESGKALGFSNLRVLFNHIIPNALGPVMISLAFGISSAILFESTLSFLGIGLAAEQVSWGSLLAAARSDYSAWWLAVFPGILLFLTILNLNKLGDRLSS